MSKLSLGVQKAPPKPTSDLAIEGVAYEEAGLVLSEGLPFESWSAVGSALSRMDKAVHWWIGDWVRFGERKYGEQYAQAMDATDFEYQTINADQWVASRIELMRRRISLSWSHHREVAALEPDEQDAWLDRAEIEGLGHKELRRLIRTPVLDDVPPPAGTYRCIVIDPPWPMDKIEREVRPNQGPVLDYPTMTLEQIASLPIADLSASPGTHVYLWTTHRFLPDALRLFEEWGVSYQCLMTWVKNVGITPFSWMYDTEHVLFGRIGSLPLEQMGLRLSFSAPTTGHSSKPDVFYERVVDASPEPRLEMFARSAREGFDTWGNEAPDGS